MKYYRSVFVPLCCKRKGIVMQSNKYIIIFRVAYKYKDYFKYDKKYKPIIFEPGETNDELFKSYNAEYLIKQLENNPLFFKKFIKE